MVDKKMVLKDGYAHAARAGLEAYLKDAELVKIYKEKIMAHAEECKCALTEEEVLSYIHQQMNDIDMLQEKNESPVELRFQAS